MDPTHREILRFENRIRRDCEIWNHIATMQDKSKDPKYQHTKAERETHWSGYRITNMDNTGRAAAIQTNPQYSLATPRNRLTLLESPKPISEQPEEKHRHRRRRRKAHMDRSQCFSGQTGQYGAVPHPLPDWESIAMARMMLTEPTPFWQVFDTFFLFCCVMCLCDSTDPAGKALWTGGIEYPHVTHAV